MSRSSPSSSESESFHPDRAITSASEDTLGRLKLAQDLGRRLAAWRGDSSLVVALYGDWGTGKTSVKNMALEEIRERFAEKAQIVEFNPWQIHGLEQLTESFFREIGPKLTAAKDEDGAAVRKKSWERYANYVGAGLSVAKALRFALPMLGVPLSEPILGKLQETLGHIRELTQSGAEAAGRAEAKAESLADLKERLRADLKTLPHSILVVIDDLDRLTGEEVCHVLRLVKANADLPNFCFLLLCERTNVEKALGNISNGRGDAFLEKIVQVGIDVPAPPIEKVHEHLGRSIDSILTNVGVGEQDFEQERWVNIWIPGISKYLTNLRHVDRFLNAFTVSASAFSSEGAYEVDPIDLIAVECFRMFEPSALALIRRNKRVLTTQRESDRNEDLSSALEEIIGAAKNPSAAREIVGELFPNSHRVWRNMSYSGESYLAWKRLRRLCDEDFFDRYFQLDVPAGQVPEADIARILAHRTEREAMRRILDSLIERELIVPALMRLEANDELNDPETAEPYLLAMCDVADSLPVSGRLGWPVERSARALVRYALNRVLGKIADNDQKLKLVKSLITDAQSLSMPVEILSRLMRTKDDQLFPKAPEAVREKLKNHMVRRIKTVADAGQLLQHSDLGLILHGWNEWDREDSSAWVTETLSSPTSGIVVLEKLTSTSFSQGMGSGYWQQHRLVYRDSLERLASFEQWAQMADSITDPTTLSKDQQDALRAFRAAQERREKGIPDDRLLTDD